MKKKQYFFLHSSINNTLTTGPGYNLIIHVSKLSYRETLLKLQYHSNELRS